MSRKKIIAALGSVALFFIPLAFANALTISPARVEITGDPGQIIRGECLLVNNKDETKTFYTSFENFEAQGETGAPNFVTAVEGLGTWINSEPKVILNPKENKKIEYTITIPYDADPGGHYAGIFWGTTDPNTTGGDEQVSIGAKIGVIILLSVTGDIEEGGGVLEFGTVGQDIINEEDKTIAKKIFTTLPVDFEYRFRNSGDDRIKPKGEVAVKNTFGITTSVLNVNRQEGNVLPRSIRKYSFFWNGVDDVDKPDKRLEEPKGFFKTVAYQVKHFAFGMYTAKMDLKYGTTGELSDSAKCVFFVLPWQLMVLVALVLVAVWRLLKLYNQMIIRKAQKTIQKTSENMETKDTKDPGEKSEVS